ncbi:hypothetical protein [Anaeromicrobium sediminis]|uniref:Uncharacterized protein n=1 Tax=Anaeromicrobium sediminis TaxID=1478221 RepID=A0A267MQ36_9FIRM|nr:hypothetical protein [Anaeromicrobium sediminis]PAB61008.1 hypothetical protein CCE28_00830 [Anaeromicrobium sediminis]
MKLFDFLVGCLDQANNDKIFPSIIDVSSYMNEVHILTRIENQIKNYIEEEILVEVDLEYIIKLPKSYSKYIQYEHTNNKIEKKENIDLEKMKNIDWKSVRDCFKYTDDHTEKEVKKF